MHYKLEKYIPRIPEYLARAAVGDPYAIAMLALLGVVTVSAVIKANK